VKRDLPQYWTAQLFAVIILFSIGASLFPIGYIASSYQPTYLHHPVYTYMGSFEANLTVASPIANVSVGDCDTIDVSDERWEDAVPVTLRVHNDTDTLFAMIPSFGGEPTWYSAAVELHFSTVQNYTVQVEREAQDTLFRCYIYAYVKLQPPVVIPVPTISTTILCYGAGTLLMLFGLVLTSNFIRRTRTFYWTT